MSKLYFTVFIIIAIIILAVIFLFVPEVWNIINKFLEIIKIKLSVLWVF